MENRDFIQDLSRRLAAALPDSARTLRDDAERNLRGVLDTAFERMELVTREEFDAQAEVLARTRAKLEELERRVAELEGGPEEAAADTSDEGDDPAR
ncbi:MAG: accessory factor UbiK family protein [Thiohalospira sp.]